MSKYPPCGNPGCPACGIPDPRDIELMRERTKDFSELEAQVMRTLSMLIGKLPTDHAKVEAIRTIKAMAPLVGNIFDRGCEVAAVAMHSAKH